MRTIFFFLIMMLGCNLCLLGADTAVLDAGDERGRLDALVETIRMLGHKAEKLPLAELRRPSGLQCYDCIFLAHHSGYLAESEYQILAEYVADGGTLLLSGMAAFWMRLPGSPEKRRRIAGEGPLKEAAGVKIINHLEAPVRALTIRQQVQATKGLPEKFTLQTTPAYSLDKKTAWRGAGALHLSSVSAEALIEAEMKDAKGEIITGDFLTINHYGRGRCYRLALYSISSMLLTKKEKNMTLILMNILQEAEQGQKNLTQRH